MIKRLIFRLPLRREHLPLMPFLVHRREGRCSLVLEWKFIKVKQLASISDQGTFLLMYVRKKQQQMSVQIKNKQVKSYSCHCLPFSTQRKGREFDFLHIFLEAAKFDPTIGGSGLLALPFFFSLFCKSSVEVGVFFSLLLTAHIHIFFSLCSGS